eukprot:TRINITY_DN20557_c0_g1_i2.p1 TRINITY_DN20557_c0_g1~~TRINITY_DN20557_c0_g1_i2.p1  ORF type:complete len:367 (+),score=71.21 TRINITY_DN20557_c0_g1_i2:62-1162(+)
MMPSVPLLAWLCALSSPLVHGLRFRAKPPPGSHAIRGNGSAAATSFVTTAGYSRNCWGPPTGPIDEDFLSAWEPNDEAQSRWVELEPKELLTPPAESSAGPVKPKVALLMFIKDEVFNPHIWQTWMDQAKAAGLDVTMLIHAYGLAPEADMAQDYFKSFLVHKQAPTAWCNMWEAEILLFKEALADASITHLATVSADSVPLQPLTYMYKALADEPATRLCLDRHWEIPRAETWWVMTRSHASLFLDNKDLVRSTFVNGCTEEIAFAYPLLLRHKSWPEQTRLLDECVMFTDWVNTCKQWADHTAMCECSSLRADEHDEASGIHPRNYLSVSGESWKELRRSSFWFGRKFAKDALAGITEPWRDLD